MNSKTQVNSNSLDIKLKTIPGVFSPSGVDGGTALLLNKIEVLDKTVVADLGCGSGVIGITLAKKYPRSHIHLLDDHIRAVNLALENVELNQTKNAEVYLSDLFSAVSDRSYHQIVANPPAQLGNAFLQELIDESFFHLKPGGILWLVVKKNLKSVIDRMLQKKFSHYIIVASGREHVVFKSQK